MTRTYIFSLFVIFNSLIWIQCEDMIICGGFVKSHANIEFTKVEVELTLNQGKQSFKTDCSPSNGYFFLPVDIKGEYTLRVLAPLGWSFEPEKYDINFDGKTDICSQGKDVNFVFKGFGITGRIANIGGDATNVDIQLRSADGKDVRYTKSDANGDFFFTPVVPGPYTIEVSRHNWHFEKSKYDVMVTAGNTELPADAFIVSGFDVRGHILNAEEQLSSVDFVLFARNNAQKQLACKSEDAASVKPVLPAYDSTYSCSVTPTMSGHFELKSISPGKYLIQPRLLSETIEFQMIPEYLEFEVTSDVVELTQTFEITGFSVFGRVRSSANGFGIANAGIFVNGQHVATTHTDGTYKLENIKTNTYKIAANADQVRFGEKLVKISMTNPSIPDIVVAEYQVCGLVASQHAYTVAITKHASTFHTQAKSKAETGEWCVYLEPGKYSIQILTSSEDSASGIQFFPKQQDIEVTTSPLSGITFSQLRATVTGEVKCLTDGKGAALCRASEITLNSLDADGNRNGHITKAKLINGKYSFSEVLPGTYEVSIPTSLLCWESNTLTLIVKSASEIVPTFVHIGYLVSISSSHHTMMKYALSSTTQIEPIAREILLAPGINSFCVDKFGEYDLKFSGCHTYDASATKSFKTGVEYPVAVNAIKHRNGVQIFSDTKTTFKVLAVHENGEKQLITFAEVPNKQQDATQTVYQHNFDLKHNEILTLIPQGETVLFTPPSKDILGGNDCIENTFTFNAAKGLIINGEVTPPIGNVKITLMFIDDPSQAPLEVLTTSDGHFKFGPLNRNLNVALSAAKESYVFSEFDTTRNEFRAHKLCEVIATVKDDNNNKLAGALLSLSGLDSYRNNLFTGDDGTIVFHSLSPSQYYLRPMMKEYRFEPSSKLIDVKDGETVRVDLSGKRVAYSAFGSVNALNGLPIADVVVEARSNEQCNHHQEEVTTQSSGQYRLRGLQPGCEYTIRVRSNNENSVVVDRTVPSVHTITIDRDDVQNVNIIALNPLSHTDVIARVTATNTDYYKSLSVQIYKKGNTDIPLYSHRVEPPASARSNPEAGVMIFFPRIPFDGRTYVVELTSTLSDKTFAYILPSEQFDANQSTIYIDLNFSPEIHFNESDLNENSFSAIILIGLVVIAFFKQDLAVEFLTFAWSKINALTKRTLNQTTSPKRKDNRFDASYNDTEIEKLAQSINATKKKGVRRTPTQ